MSIGGYLPLTIAQGATFYQSFQWLQGGGKKPTDGAPVKLYGYQGRCQIRNGAQHPGVIMTVPVEIVNEAEGRFAISLAAEQTAAIPATGGFCLDIEKYTYDVELFNSEGTVYRILNGVIAVSPEITK